MSLAGLLARRAIVLTEGSVFELLRRDPRVGFDAHIAHAGLIYDEPTRELLAGVHRAYLRIAERSSLPMIAFADTWRASGDRIAASAFRDRSVNRDNLEFIRDLATRSGGRVFAGALTGPRGDAYRPEEAPTAEEAKRYHAFQIAELARGGAEVIVAATLPALGEAKGIASLLSQSGTPWMLSFVVRPSGVLLDGTPLAAAIAEIDDSVVTPPAGYSINCVHPEIARQALSQLDEHARARVIAFQGNTSARSPEELDNLPEVESTEPETFAASIATLMRESSVHVVGGCCGTDERHISTIAEVIAVSDPVGDADRFAF